MATPSPPPLFGQWLVCAVCLVTVGCTPLGLGTRKRAENAFRRQNQLSADFMLAAGEMESRAPEIYQHLLAKEEQMLDACLPLNTVASLHREGQRPDIYEKAAVVKSLKPCERASSDFDAALRQARRRLPQP